MKDYEDYKNKDEKIKTIDEDAYYNDYNKIAKNNKTKTGRRLKTEEDEDNFEYVINVPKTNNKQEKKMFLMMILII